ncbi:MAG: glycosyltransferase family 39 protein [Longimicrobiales bacterium]
MPSDPAPWEAEIQIGAASDDFSARSSAGGIPPILWGIVLLGLGLRFWGISFGLPNLYARPDEIEVVARAIRFFSGDLNPHFFQYPSLFFYLTAAVFAVFLGIRGLTGPGLEHLLAEAAVDPDPFFLLARGVSAVFGVLTIIVVYLGAKRFLNREAGLIAAFFLAVSPLHVRDSHFATTDVVLTYFTILAGFAVLRVLAEGGWRAYAWAGVTSGLVTATKYIGILFVAPLLLAHFLRPGGTGGSAQEVPTRVDRIIRKLAHPGPWIFLLCAAAAVFLTSPFTFLDFPVSWSNFRFQLAHLDSGHQVLLGPAWMYHLRFTLPMGLGLPVFLTAIGGSCLLLYRYPVQTLVLFGFPALFALSTASGQTVFLRYMLPLFPFASLAAGYGVWWLVQRMPIQGKPRAAILITLLLAAPGLYRTVNMDAFLSLKDSRVLATEWLQENSDGVVRVHLTGSEYGHPKLPPPPDSLRTLLGRIKSSAPQPDFLAARSFVEKRLEAQLAHRMAEGPEEGFLYVPESEISRADWIVVQWSPLGAYSRPSTEMEAYLEECCREVHRIPGVPVSLELGWYDQQDAFFLPMKNFRGVVRPGPTLSIYRHRSPGRVSDRESPGGERR